MIYVQQQVLCNQLIGNILCICKFIEYNDCCVGCMPICKKRNKKMYLQIKIHVCIIKTNLSSTLKTNIRGFECVEKHRCAGCYKNEVKQNKYECILSIRFVNIKDDDIIIFDVCLTISMCIGSYLWMDFLDFNTALEKVDCFSFFNIRYNKIILY